MLHLRRHHHRSRLLPPALLPQYHHRPLSTTVAPTKISFDDEDKTALRSVVRKFVDKEINPNVDKWEREGKFPAHSLFKKAGELGLLGLTKPEQFGGSGLDFSASIVWAEELGRARHGSTPMALGVQTDMATPALARFGSDELRQRFLVPTIKGDWVACLGVSETGAGSDVANIKTSAKKDGPNHLLINGSKCWITNSTQADWMCLLVNTEPNVSSPHRNKSLICVPMNTPGVSVSKVIDKMGMRASDTAIINFDNVRVPSSNVIGTQGEGFKYQMIQFQEERLYAAASILGALELCVNETAQYCMERHLFGKPLLDNQSVHFKLGELVTEIEALRALIYRATSKYVEKGEDVTEWASMCKLKAGRLCRIVTDSCLQYHGGMGMTEENIVSRFYRDHRLTSIGGGSDETQLSIIAKLRGWLGGGNNKKR